MTNEERSVSYVDELELEPDTKSHHSLTVGQTPIGDYSLPLVALRGAQPGPVVTIISGVHACEYTGPVTCMRLQTELDTAELRGTVLIVPVVNLRSLELRTPFVSPLDGRNLFNLFPGSEYGTISEKVAHAIFENLVKGSDAFFDLHSGDLFEAIPPHTCFQLSGDADVDDRSRALATLFEIDLLNIMGDGIDDLARTNDAEGTAFYGIPSANMSTGSAARAGVPAVLLEVGGAGTLDMELVEMELRGFRNVFRSLGMLPGAADDGIAHTPCYGMYVLTSKFGGMFLPDVAPGDHVEEGQRLGEMRDLRANVLAEFHSPMTGVVLMMFTSPVRTSGETLLILSRTDEPGGP